jgi:hypothetical protein
MYCIGAVLWSFSDIQVRSFFWLARVCGHGGRCSHGGLARLCDHIYTLILFLLFIPVAHFCSKPIYPLVTE